MKKPFFIYAAFWVFYIIFPYILGITALDVTIRATVLAWAIYVIFQKAVNKRRSQVYGLSESILFNKILFYIALFISIYSLIILIISGVNPFMQSRSDLFLQGEASSNGFMVISFGILTIQAIKLSHINRRFLLSLAIPIMFDILTLGRGFILAVFITVLIKFRISLLKLFPLALIISIVMVMRIEGSVSIDSFFLYLSGESANTAMGNALMAGSDFHLSFLQALRPLFGFMPFIGRLVGIESEAMAYNSLLDIKFDQYGLAFGILGFAKFSSLFYLLIFLAAVYMSIQIALKLGVSKDFLLLSFAFETPTIFRWSPGEGAAQIFRMCAVFIVLLIVISFSIRRKRRLTEGLVSIT